MHTNDHKNDPNSWAFSALTGLWSLPKLAKQAKRLLNNVQDGQQGACEAQQFTEVVETKVHQVSSQIDHLTEGTRSQSG